MHSNKHVLSTFQINRYGGFGAVRRSVSRSVRTCSITIYYVLIEDDMELEKTSSEGVLTRTDRVLLSIARAVLSRRPVASHEYCAYTTRILRRTSFLRNSYL